MHCGNYVKGHIDRRPESIEPTMHTRNDTIPSKTTDYAKSTERFARDRLLRNIHDNV